MSTENVLPENKALEIYGANQIEGATPGRLVLITFDYCLSKIRQGDVFESKKAIVELMGSLNLDYLDIAGPLYRIYEYTLDVVREQRFDEALEIVSELREAWVKVIERVENRQTLSMETTQA